MYTHRADPLSDSLSPLCGKPALNSVVKYVLVLIGEQPNQLGSEQSAHVPDSRKMWIRPAKFPGGRVASFVKVHHSYKQKYAFTLSTACSVIAMDTSDCTIWPSGRVTSDWYMAFSGIAKSQLGS